jgi:chitinase
VQIDFTVPVDPTGLESNAINLLKGAKSKGVKVNLVNIMTMDFGDGQNALADAESAAKATATQLESVYGVSASQAWNMLGLTPIAGQNDDNENFTQANASTLESFAASHGVQELAFWEVDGYDKGTGYAYSKIFNRITGGSTGGGGGGGSGQTYVGAQSGKCIDDNNSSTTNGTQLEIYTCNGGANQSIATSGSTLQVEGKCVDASGSQTANGTAVDINTCDGTANQNWTYNASTGTIVGAQSGKCITVQGASTANLAKLILYTCNGGANQKWTQQ